MDQDTRDLKEKIDLFLRDSFLTIKKLKNTDFGSVLEDEIQEMQTISQRIWDLHHFSQKLLANHPSESNYYNAKIIKDLIEEQIGRHANSLIKAADLAKKNSDYKHMKAIILELAREDSAREVLFENLKEISQELAA